MLAIACLAIVGWVGDVTALRSIRRGWTPMSVVTAACLTLSGLALLWVNSSAPWKRFLCTLCGIVVGATAAVRFAAYSAPRIVGHEIDWPAGLFRNWFAGDKSYMALLTALTLMGLAGALLMLRHGGRRPARVAHAIVLVLAPFIYIVTAGYVFNVPSIHGWLGIPAAVNTDIALFALCIGLLCARTDTWLVAPLVGAQAGATMARRLLVPLLLLPLIIGWLRIHGERRGLFESAIGVILVAASYAICFFFLTWWNARAVNRQQARSEAALREARDALETQVQERTRELRHSLETLREETAQRARAEAEALAAGLYARSLIEASLDPLVTISPEGKITDVNKATEEATGIAREKLIGSDFSSYFTEPGKARAGYLAVIAAGAVRDYPLTIRHVSGRTMDVLYNATTYRDKSGRTLGVFAAARDVTERKKAETELEQYRRHLEELVAQRTSELEKAAAELGRSNKDLEQFAYVASHDLQEPLRAVSGFMSILGAQYADKLDANGREYVTHAVEGAERMQSLINDLLAYSRVDSRGGEFRSVNMQSALDAAMANLRPAIEECGAVISGDHLPTITADSSQMIQLFQNLVGNAVKFRGTRRPQISVSARREDGRWIFAVRDNGIGIEPQYYERIFLIFQRLHSRTHYPGTGIGLAVCKRIVERHSGTIWVESVPGEGTTFFFSIPDRGDTA